MNMGTIKNLYAEYDRIKDSVSPIMGQIEGYLSEAKDIEGKLNSTNATINLLTKTKDNMSDTIKGAYANDDMDAKVPIYSGAKADVANEILANFAPRVPAGEEGDLDNPNPGSGLEGAAGGRTPEQQTAIDNAMAAYAQKNEGTFESGVQAFTCSLGKNARSGAQPLISGASNSAHSFGESCWITH